MNVQRRVFVQIPSYRDPQLIPTLIDLIENASAPGAIRVVVCWQHGPDEDLAAFTACGFRLGSTDAIHGHLVHSLELRGVAVELIDIAFENAEGAGWARSVAQQRYQGEAYNLQIDAHHRFVKAWDREMIGMLESLMSISTKPLLTGHPPAFWPETYPAGRQEQPTIMYVANFSALGIVRFMAKLVAPASLRSRPWRARFMSGGFVFSPGSFIREVAQDPSHYFATEEVIMTVRAYTHGYDMFHADRVLLWHYYGNRSPKVWEDHADDQASSPPPARTVDERVLGSARRARSLLGLDSDSDGRHDTSFGLGTVRTLQEYERYAGVSFSLRGVHESTTAGGEPDESLLDVDGADWEMRLVCRRRIRVVVSFDPTEEIQLYSAYVAMRTACGEVVVVKDLSGQEIIALLASGTLAFVYEHSSNPKGLPAAFGVEAATNYPDAERFFSVIAQDILD
ncbi:GlcNAc-transferase family protein [Stenotrophomonas sp. NPDC077464]|uniref:GlcNAc-transferase family protein n=1 Tax=unclassified Stenotrophomonas TaxID=196198 RepID=UPI0037D731D4